VELGKEVLDARHDQLITLLGMDFEKLSPRSPRAAVQGPTKGNTLPLRAREPIAPTVPMAAVKATLPVLTLKSSEEMHLAGAVTGPVPSSRGSLVSMILVATGALCVGLLATFLAIRPDRSSTAAAVSSSSPMPRASPALAPTTSAISVAPDVPLPSASAAAEPSASSRPATTKSSPPVGGTGGSRPKPPVKPLLQPNPYDDSK
jgi:hypothetical protein